MKKARLDVLLVELGLATGRDKAKALIMQGIVYVNGQKALRPGEEYAMQQQIEVRGKTLSYVSRGGLKLEKAVKVFEITVNNTVCADIGASTGGFTDCLLGQGAKKVYAVDVGYGQLAWSLRSDERVVVLERTNARYLTDAEIPEPLQLIVIDVSFISLTLLLPALRKLMDAEGHILCLIKPQFEAGRDKVGKKGVVRDPATHQQVICKVAEHARRLGLAVAGLDYSPIKGPQGNIEYLMYLEQRADAPEASADIIRKVVAGAARDLEENDEGSNIAKP